MHLPASRSVRIAAVAAIIGVPSMWLVAHGHDAGDATLVAPAKRGRFTVTVTTSGELRARRFVQITAPPNAMQAGAFQMKISSIVPEGTVVRAGEVVAELDRSTVASKLNDVTLALQKAQAQYEQAMLDSALTLSAARENIHTLELGLEEKRLAKEGSVYEAPTVRRQAEIDLEKAQRALDQARTDYTTKTEQSRAKMREVGADLARQRSLLQVVQEVMAGFTIRAPSPGMVIYVKEWNGRKRTTGSQVTSWDPGVATLPDLTQMESVTYVNEIDVRKIAVGQPVGITLDADPTKKLSGTVASVANVGEQRPNADAKVFEVRVTVAGADTTLRPGMTTGNAIETYTTENALFVPIEAVNSEDGIAFVYRQSGGGAVKQEVVTGAMSDDEVIVLRGLKDGDRVLLTPPRDHDRMALKRLPASERAVPAAGGDTALRPPASPTVPPGDSALHPLPAPRGSRPQRSSPRQPRD
ncbi:MAG TPA: efflux RND transporter periplasmic adaptor subunit [Gemmatimonadales bacterium]|nr:efflux RND transporter periplasmic adaptor subunit [Gemmatimonadales bacterium]